MELSLRQLMIAAVTSLTLAGTAIAADMSDAAIAERIKPVGAVYLEGDAPAALWLPQGRAVEMPSMAPSVLPVMVPV